MFSRRKAVDPNDVFTPRSHEVNQKMYVSRETQEKKLVRSASGSKNIIIHGESGCGKSWLYKKVFKDNGYVYQTANMASVSRLGSVNAVLKDRFNRLKDASNSGGQQEIGGSFGPSFARVTTKFIKTVEKIMPEPFDRCLAVIKQISGGQRAFLVIENIESIVGTPRFVEEVAGLITLLDDEDYASFNVKLVVVGVPSEIQRYLSSTQKYGRTIANRIDEIPEVERLRPEDAGELLRRGLVDLLGLELFEVDLKRVAWRADFIPQHLHEVGLAISRIAIETGEKIDASTVEQAMKEWLAETLTADYMAIDALMNSKRTKIGRRDQALYVIAHMRAAEFKSAEVERDLRILFPSSTQGTALNTPQLLSELSKGDSPIIRQTPKGNAYQFVSPKLKICARNILARREDERVDRLSIGDVDN